MTTEEAKILLANLKRYMSGGGVIDRNANKAIDMAIEALKHHEPHWIPCNKKLPTKSDIYLVSSYDKLVFELYFSTEYGWDGWWNGRIGAWMPLPEPWKGE